MAAKSILWACVAITDVQVCVAGIPPECFLRSGIWVIGTPLNQSWWASPWTRSVAGKLLRTALCKSTDPLYSCICSRLWYCIWAASPVGTYSHANEFTWCWRSGNTEEEKKKQLWPSKPPGVPKGTIHQWVVLPLQLLQGLSVCKYAPLAVCIPRLLYVLIPECLSLSRLNRSAQTAALSVICKS